MSGVDMSPAAILARLREVERLSDLRPERRLDTKIDMSPEAIDRRLAEVEQARLLCAALAERPGARPARVDDGTAEGGVEDAGGG